MVVNSYILVPLATWAIAQIIKVTLAALRGRLDLRYLYASGGMPSVHSAVVVALATTAYLSDGAASHLFGFTVVFAAIVMYDSLGVRRSAGEQSVALNMLIGSLSRGKIKLDQPDLKLREVLGHRPFEVVVGAGLGLVLGGLFNYRRITPLTDFMQQVPGMTEMIWYLAVFAVLIVGGILQRVILKNRYPKSKVYNRLTGRVMTATQVTGWVGLVLVALQYEHASYLAWRGWVAALIITGICWLTSVLLTAARTMPATLANEANTARKMKWLTLGRKRKK